MKKEDFIIGRWYKNLGSSKNYIGKFSHFGSDNSMRVLDHIKYNELKLGLCNLTASYTKAIECSIDEIRHLLPKDHPDLLLETTLNNFEVW